ncbi:MAG: RNA methyltransferase [Candidatus Nanoarchaeia archaeon]|nr:RNA methyltransferase [Candidatus Nanoarchaeia archaeon]
MRGYFGIGIYSPKTECNIGTLWRSAYQLGASFIFTIAHRYKKQCSDTYKAYRYIPLIQFSNYENFISSPFYDCIVIAIDFNKNMDASFFVELKNFHHPQRCMYLLGSEDNGLPEQIIRKSHYCIYIPSIRKESYNVSVAGSIVMYDRLMKGENNG